MNPYVEIERLNEQLYNASCIIRDQTVVINKSMMKIRLLENFLHGDENETSPFVSAVNSYSGYTCECKYCGKKYNVNYKMLYTTSNDQLKYVTCECSAILVIMKKCICNFFFFTKDHYKKYCRTCYNSYCVNQSQAISMSSSTYTESTT